MVMIDGQICDGSELIGMAKLNKVDEMVVSALKSAGKGLTLSELSETTGESPKKVFKSLRKLFENGMVDCENRQYRLLGP